MDTLLWVTSSSGFSLKMKVTRSGSSIGMGKLRSALTTL